MSYSWKSPWRAGVIALALASLIFSTAPMPVQGQSTDQCPALVNDALNQLEARCESLDRNFACYGNNDVLAEFARDVAPAFFTTPGEIAQLIELENIETQPLNLQANTWGVALMNVQANLPNTLPGQSVVMLLFGDTYVEDNVDPTEAFTSETEILVETDRNIPLRLEPDAGSEILGTLPANTEVPADAMAPNDWVRVAFNDQFGWIPPQVIAMPRGLNLLPTVTEATRTPMQSFYFSTGIGASECEETPDSLIVQGPEQLVVDIQANGADIRIGSTIALLTNENTTPPQMEVVVLQGETEITCDNGGSVTLQQGESSLSDLSPLSDLGVVAEVENREALCNWTEPELQPLSRLLTIAGPACDASTGLLNYDLNCDNIVAEEETPTPPPPVVSVPQGQAPQGSVPQVQTEEPPPPPVVVVQPTAPPPPPDNDDDDDDDDDDGDDNPVVQVADAALSLGVSIAVVPEVGEEVALEITVTNVGDLNLTNVVIGNNLGSFSGDLSLSVEGVPGGTSYNNGNNEWTIDSLPVGASERLEIFALVVTVRTYNVQFNLLSSNPADENNGNNTATTSFTSIASPDADIEVLINGQASPNITVNEDESFTFTITVENVSTTADAENVVVTDSILGGEGITGITFDSDAGSTASAGTYDDMGTWTVGTLAPGVSASLTIPVTSNVGSSGGSSPGASYGLSADGTTTSVESDTGNNTASGLLNVNFNNVAVTISGPTGNVAGGDVTVITITATNTGDSALTAVEITDDIGDADSSLLTRFSAVEDTGTYDTGAGLWTIPNLAVGASVSVDVTVEIGFPEGPETQTVSATLTNAVPDDLDGTDDSPGSPLVFDVVP
jgi:uncharacterized repeat protein (TIGR01451 family)